VCAMLALVLFAGCVSQPSGQTAPPAKEELAKELPNATVAGAENLMKVSGDEDMSTIIVSASNSGGKWYFPMADYDHRFESVGLYSSAFLMLNKSQIYWLDDGESVWLTVMRGNGSGVLFNAVYENDKVDCASGQIRILGKDYPLSDMKQGSSFQLDDKWKVARDPDNTCPKRMIVYLDGYFDGLKDGEFLSLFRNDNTILLKFMDNESVPKVEVIATRPADTLVPKSTPLLYNRTTNLTDWDASIVYNETMVSNGDGLLLSFEPAIPICTTSRCDFGPDGYSDYATDIHDMLLEMPAGERVITKLRKNGSAESLTIAKEEENKIIMQSLCNQSAGNNTETMSAGGADWCFEDMDQSNGTMKAMMANDLGIRYQEIPVGTDLKIGNDYLHLWMIAPGYTFGSWASLSVLSDILNLTDPANNVTLAWENETSQNPALRSIFIPRTSPVYGDLTGASG
jgi:hypothetical protein